MVQSPPPLFKQGPSAFVRLMVFVALAFGLLIFDARYRSLAALHQAVGIGLYPVQRIALMPRKLAHGISSFFISLTALRIENQWLRTQRLEFAAAAQQAAQLAAENAQLRALLQLDARRSSETTLAEVQYDIPNPFTQKLMINRGSQHGIQAGAPVINEIGVMGQVTRAYSAHAEVTLITDKDQAVPVQFVRSGLRSVMYGTPRGDTLEIRFIPIRSDIRIDDSIVTSGLDGVFPPGLAVAKVIRIDRQSDEAFLRVICKPTAPVRNTRQLLVLRYQTPPQQAAEQADLERAAGHAEPLNPSASSQP